jgi:hypothetical protein
MKKGTHKISKADKMKDTLKSIYLRLDVDMQNLASKAIAQIIVKIVYSHEKSMSKNDIKEELAKINGGKSFNDVEINNVLDDLANKELSYHSGRYSLSKSKRDRIGQTVAESEQRRNDIIDKYFSGLNSDRAVVEEWLMEMSIKFFESFSDEWISDLLAKTDRVVCNADSIRDQVTRRTQSMKQIDKDDKEVLPDRFFNFINSHEDIVDAYLWEYGTSAFSSKLIRNKHGVDKLTIETFKDSCCILDTNILLFIALENKYKDSFKAIEKVFGDLNVNVGILYITKREYENKVNSQKNATLSNLEKFGYEVASMPDDDFTRMALQYHCRTNQDFERYFDYNLSLPSHISEQVEISLKDDDRELVTVIDKAQSDQSLMDKLNNISKLIKHRPKRDSACRHDIGLIEGVRFWRSSSEPEKNKCFILSDDTAINRYSKQYGSKQGLPLALRVDTLINMLAINNGGDTFDAADYRPLFANIIRLGLIPRKDTFRQTELYQLSLMNERIVDLPAEEVRVIAKEMHKRFLEGESEENIRRDLNEMVTKGEIAAKDEVKKVQERIVYESRQKEYYQTESINDKLKLVQTVRKQVENDYDLKARNQRILFWVLLTVVTIVLAVIVVYLVKKNTPNGTLIESLFIGFGGSAILELLVGFIVQAKMIRNRKKDRSRAIEDELARRLSEMDKQ